MEKLIKPFSGIYRWILSSLMKVNKIFFRNLNLMKVNKFWWKINNFWKSTILDEKSTISDFEIPFEHKNGFPRNLNLKSIEPIFNFFGQESIFSCKRKNQFPWTKNHLFLWTRVNNFLVYKKVNNSIRWT